LKCKDSICIDQTHLEVYGRSLHKNVYAFFLQAIQHTQDSHCMQPGQNDHLALNICFVD